MVLTTPRIREESRAAGTLLGLLVSARRYKAALLVLLSLLFAGVGVGVSTPATARAAVVPPLLWSAPVRVADVSINSVSCPAKSLCVASDNDGHIISSTAPARGEWQRVDADGGSALTSVSCPTRALCVAVSGRGDVVTSTDPGGPAGVWSAARVDTITQPGPYGAGPNLLRGVSCPTVSFCLAVDSAGNALWSGDPTGGVAAWTSEHIDDNQVNNCTGTTLNCQVPLMGVACPGLASCLAVDEGNDILASGTPSAGTAWASTRAPGTGPQSLWGVSCPSAAFCAAVDGSGSLVITWDPATGSPPVAHRLPIDAYGIWCESAELCLASGESRGNDSELYASLDPAGSSASWRPTVPGYVTAVSCATPAACVAADDEGQLMAGATSSSLIATLSRAALRGVPRPRALLRGDGYTVHFPAPLPGRLAITWTTAHGTPLTLATGSSTFSGAATHPVRVTLTPAARSLLRTQASVAVSARATFTAGSGAVSAVRRFVVRRG